MGCVKQCSINKSSPLYTHVQNPQCQIGVYTRSLRACQLAGSIGQKWPVEFNDFFYSVKQSSYREASYANDALLLSKVGTACLR